MALSWVKSRPVAIQLLMVSPKRMPTFWLVSVAMRWGASGMKGLGRRCSSTSARKSLGFRMPGSVTTGNPSW